MIFCYRSNSGEVIDWEAPIGKAPTSVQIGEVVYERFYGAENKVLKQLTPLDRGDKPSVSHQLPAYYGYGQREQVWKEHMQRADIEDTPHRRWQMRQAGLVPSPKYIEKRSREAAAKAGVLDRFDKKGRPIARSKREVGRVLDTAKKVGDSLEWS